MKAALLYYRGSGLVAWFIRWFTRSKFAHVAPAIIMSDGRVHRFDAYWATGVTLNKSSLLSDACSVQLLDFSEPEKNLSPVLRKHLWLLHQIGKPYDKWSIVLIGLTKRLPGWLHVYVSRQGEWICSRLACDFADLELAAWGLNGPPSPEDVHRIVAQAHPAG